MRDSITVITLTRGRPQLLSRAIESVQKQVYGGSILHLVLIDDCLTTLNVFSRAINRNKGIAWQFMSREPGEKTGPARLAKLRNYGINIADTEWVSFLDDDNEFEPDHLSSLVACAK